MSQRDRAAVVDDDDEDNGAGVRRVAGNGNGNNGGKKCRKQKYRDYFIEPNGCRFLQLSTAI
jgi:hypothetical protein